MKLFPHRLKDNKDKEKDVDDFKSSSQTANKSKLMKKIERESKSFVPDLCETSDLSTDSDRVSNEEEEEEEDISVDAKLDRARQRREKAKKELELILNDKNEQAFQRAQENIESKREKYRTENEKVDQVNQKKILMEKRRRKYAMHSITNRLNMASTRAEENLKKKQRRARQNKRIERAQNKRALIEFERRSAVLSSLGHRTERANRNLQLRLEDLQDKARVEIEHAHDVAKRVKSTRILQNAIRQKFGFKEQCDQVNISMTAASLRFQNCYSWKTMVIATRLSNNSDVQNLKDLLGVLGLPNRNTSTPSFEELTAAITNIKNLQFAHSLLRTLSPLLANSSRQIKPDTISPRTLLSVFLVALQPEEVLADKRGNDKCSKLLETSSRSLIHALEDLSKIDFSEATRGSIYMCIQRLCSMILSYCTLFDKWKSADLDDLVSKMIKSAKQSWIAFLTSKEALLYIEEKSSNENEHFRHLIKYKSSKKGAASHIKRIRASMEKLLGKEQSLVEMREAKRFAIDRIDNEKLIVAIKDEIDMAFMTSNDSYEENANSQPSNKRYGDIPEAVSSNYQLVHDILLMDDEELADLSKHESENYSLFNNVEEFMEHYKSLTIFDPNNESANGGNIKALMIDLNNKLKSLVPNRKDLHQFFKSDQINACKASNDYCSLILNMAQVLMQFLESEYRSASTQEWYQVTAQWRTDESTSIPYEFDCWKTYLEASLSFLAGKADLCQMDVLNFQLVKFAPIVKTHGKEYELHAFEEKFGNISDLSSKNFIATWKWVKHIRENYGSESFVNQLKLGFVNEILFATDSLAIPEVLSLDMNQLRNIRDKARLSVISGSLILHAYKMTNTQFTNNNGEMFPSEAKYWKEKLNKTLTSYLSLDAMTLNVSECITMFTQTIAGKSLEKREVETLRNVTCSVLRGSDPVFILLDKRMKMAFQDAIKFTVTKDENISTPPSTMKTGRATNVQSGEKKLSVANIQFNHFVQKQFKKLGFSAVEDVLLCATYQAYKVITHCIDLYGEILLIPMFRKLLEDSN